jgi:hypothetical protein
MHSLRDCWSSQTANGVLNPLSIPKLCIVTFLHALRQVRGPFRGNLRRWLTRPLTLLVDFCFVVKAAGFGRSSLEEASINCHFCVFITAILNFLRICCCFLCRFHLVVQFTKIIIQRLGSINDERPDVIFGSVISSMAFQCRIDVICGILLRSSGQPVASWRGVYTA